MRKLPDRVGPVERAAFDDWSARADKYHVSGYNHHEDLWEAWQARASLDQHAATLASIEAFVACDASAISYLSLGEYRTALLKMLRQAPATKEPGA